MLNTTKLLKDPKKLIKKFLAMKWSYYNQIKEACKNDTCFNAWFYLLSYNNTWNQKDYAKFLYLNKKNYKNVFFNKIEDERF